MNETVERGRKRVLLTGATGFVGRHVHRALRDQGHDVRPVIRAGSAARLVGDAEAALNSPDIFGETPAWWALACRDIDTLVHAAWFVDPSRYLAARENLTCLAGSHALALGAIEAGVTHFIGIGTCFEYRLPSAALTVASPVEPTSLYAATKLALFQTMQALTAPTDMGFSWARLFYLHGEGEQPSRLVPYLRGCLARGEVASLSIGTQVRDFLDVRVAGEMIATIATTGQLGAINVCSGEPVTVRQLAERIADEFGRRDLLQFGTAPLRPTDPPVVVGACNLDRWQVLRGRT